jgi:hypothetical protein
MVLVQGGQDLTTVGSSFIKTGAAGLLISAPFLETPVGDAFAAASALTVKAGGFLTAIGIASQIAGGIYLARNGNSQPLDSGLLQLAQMLAENQTHVPPLPFTDPLDAPVAAAAGRDPCL